MERQDGAEQSDRRRERKSLGAWQLLLCAVFGASLASGSLWAADPSQQPSYLGGKLSFKPAADGSDAMVYVKPGLTTADVDQYKSFIIDPVTLWYADKSEFKGIFPDEMKAMADYFRQTAITALGDRYPVVSKPGPKIMRMRAAFTGMERNEPFHLYELTPVGLAFTAAKSVSGADAVTREKVLNEHSYILKATIEVGVYDSESHELLGAFWQTRDTDPEKQGADEGATWAQVKVALDAWAQELRSRLDAAHGIKTSNP